MNQDLPAVAEQSMFAEEVEEEENEPNRASSSAEQAQANLDSSALGQPDDSAAKVNLVLSTLNRHSYSVTDDMQSNVASKRGVWNVLSTLR